MSNKTTYTFPVYSDTSLTAQYKEADQITVVFSGWNGSALSSASYNIDLTDSSKIAVPAVPVPSGYEFISWELDGTAYAASAIQSAVLAKLATCTEGDTITVKAVFQQKEEEYSVTVENGTLSTGGTVGVYQPSAWITVVANEPESGKVFAYWKKDGVIVSYEETYGFFMPSDNTLVTAVYEENIVKVAGTTYIESVEVDTENSKLAFTSVSSVPDDCTIVYAGIVATSDAAKATEGVELTAYNADYVRGAASAKKLVNFTWKKSKVTADDIWYVRAYLKYTDGDGVIYEIYGDLVKADLNNGIID